MTHYDIYGKHGDLTGKKFGKLTPIMLANARPSRHIYWRCNCDCGAEVVVRASDMVLGKTHSCGCLRGRKRRDL